MESQSYNEDLYRMKNSHDHTEGPQDSSKDGPGNGSLGFWIEGEQSLSR